MNNEAIKSNGAIEATIQQLADLDALPTLDEDQLLLYAQWAGRLAAIGRPDWLERLIHRQDAAQLNRLFQRRCRKGIRNVSRFEGDFLAVEIFTAQDFALFIQYAPPESVFDSSRALMRLWERAAEAQMLDDDAAAALRMYADAFPLSEDDSFDIVAHPYTDDELAFWAGALGPLESLREDASEKLKNKVRFENITDVRNECQFRVVGCDPQEIRKIRIKSVPALPVDPDTDPALWKFDFHLCSDAFYSELRNGTVTVQTFDGARADWPAAEAFGSGTIAPARKRKSFNVFAHRPVDVMAAADGGEDKYYLLAVEGSDAVIECAVDEIDRRVLVTVYAPAPSEEYSDQLDGWIIADADGRKLGTVTHSCATIPFDDFDGNVTIKDSCGNIHDVTEVSVQK